MSTGSPAPPGRPASTVRYDLANAVATVTLDRPAARNALDTATKDALRDAVRQAADDPGVRAVVLTGVGRAFSVGQDLGEHAANLRADPAGTWRTLTEHYNPITLTLASMPKPVVAAFNGVAAGAGAAFAFACDFRVLGRSAGFNLAFAAIGLSADSGASWTLPRLVGWARAAELLLTPSTVTAERALELGLATSVVDDEAVLDTALELARRLAAGPTRAYAAIRAALAYSAVHPLEEALVFEGEQQTRAGLTQDHREAVEAFLAKRPATFAGQ